MSWEWLTLRWPDAVWHIIPGLLIYQILGTIRHELAHALAFRLCGWKLTGVYVLPHWHGGGFYWGRCTAELQGGAKHSVHISLAPYEVGALSAALWFAVMKWLPPPWAASDRLSWNLWAAFTAMFLISPVVDFLYNLGKMLFAKRGDIYKAVQYWETH
jgi:hypothetical protein